MADQVHNAGLHHRLREHGVDRLGEALQAVDDRNQGGFEPLQRLDQSCAAVTIGGGDFFGILDIDKPFDDSKRPVFASDCAGEESDILIDRRRSTGQVEVLFVDAVDDEAVSIDENAFRWPDQEPEDPVHFGRIPGQPFDKGQPG